MAQETAARTDAGTGTALARWQGGVVGGLVGGVVFGAMMTMQMRMIMEVAIPGMYGLPEGLAIGWIVHLFHSAVFGLVFAAIVGYTPLEEYLDSNLTLGLAGLAYGILVWIVAASFLMPAWVGATLPMDPPVPDFNSASAMGHAVFGVLLGIVYGVLSK